MKQSDQSMTPKEILNRGYVRRLAPDESGGYVASILEMPGCLAEGETADEAIENLDRAAESWVTVALANKQYVRDPIDFDGYSGKFALRMPRTLHKQVAELSELEGTSLNQLIVMAVTHYVTGKRLMSDLESLIRPIKSQTHINLGHVTVNLLETKTTPSEPLKFPLPQDFKLDSERVFSNLVPKLHLEHTHG